MRLVNIPIFMLCLVSGLVISAQGNITGRIVDERSGKGIFGVAIRMEERTENSTSDQEGFFKMQFFKLGSVVLKVAHKGYKTVRMPIELKNNTDQIDIGKVRLKDQNHSENQGQWLTLTDDEVVTGNDEIVNVTGLLNAGKDLFSRTTAYDFGSNFFRRRFLGSEHSTVMLNGVDLKKVFTGRPEWSNWGGLNDALRVQEQYDNMKSSSYSLGGLSHGINMISLASKQSKSLKISIAAANKSYQGRFMATYSSGLDKSGWAYSISGSLRSSHEGYRNGSKYNAYSLLLSVDKILGRGQSLNTTLIYAFNKRGLSSPLTQEVFDLKSVRYNSYWGYQQNDKRNAREKVIVEPIIQINYKNILNEKTTLHAHFTYQFGIIAASRLDYSGLNVSSNNLGFSGGGSNPDPTYYQKLPSYFLRDSLRPDYAGAYLAQKLFAENGQINWLKMYMANINTPFQKNSAYALYDDRQENRLWSLNMGFSKEINKFFSLDGVISITDYYSEHYAYMLDLLGGEGYLDVDSFADNTYQAQSNLRDPNRIVFKNEKFRYNYELTSNIFLAYLRLNYQSKKSNAFIGLSYEVKNYQRNGLYENGFYLEESSFGKSKKASFQLPSIKGGLTYKFSGRHIVVLNANYLNRAPVLKYSFSNIRISNELVKSLKSQHGIGFDLNYNWRHQRFKAMASIYFLELKDDTKVSFYYTDGLAIPEYSESGAFVQEVMTGIDNRNMGLEFSFEMPVVNNLKIKAVAALGSSVYSSDPNLYVSSNAFNSTLDLGKSYLKGYAVSSGPQQAYSFGFEYSSPHYWWLSSSLNYFRNSYVSVAPINRSGNFLIDSDGFPILGVDPLLVENLLTQEKMEPYMNLNIVGGKSWKLKNIYLGFFASINNLANSIYKTGGFEQSRNANYNSLKEDKQRSFPLFGPKYWFGYGTSFFTSFYLRI